MEILLALGALLLAAVSLGLGVRLAQNLQQVRTEALTVTQEAARAQAAAKAAAERAAELQQDVTALRDEMTELRTAIETPVLAPQPRARNRNLDDLREHLRAAHASTEEDDES